MTVIRMSVNLAVSLRCVWSSDGVERSSENCQFNTSFSTSKCLWARHWTPHCSLSINHAGLFSKWAFNGQKYFFIIINKFNQIKKHIRKIYFTYICVLTKGNALEGERETCNTKKNYTNEYMNLLSAYRWWQTEVWYCSDLVWRSYYIFLFHDEKPYFQTWTCPDAFLQLADFEICTSEVLGGVCSNTTWVKGTKWGLWSKMADFLLGLDHGSKRPFFCRSWDTTYVYRIS